MYLRRDAKKLVEFLEVTLPSEDFQKLLDKAIEWHRIEDAKKAPINIAKRAILEAASENRIPSVFPYSHLDKTIARNLPRGFKLAAQTGVSALTALGYKITEGFITTPSGSRKYLWATKEVDALGLSPEDLADLYKKSVKGRSTYKPRKGKTRKAGASQFVRVHSKRDGKVYPSVKEAAAANNLGYFQIWRSLDKPNSNWQRVTA